MLHNILIGIAALVVAAGAVFSVVIARKQKDQALDKSMNTASVRHPVLANPLLISYVIIPLAMVILIAIFLYYY